MKKIISAFLSIAMLFSICCTSVVFAEETVKTGMTSAKDTIAWSYDTATKTITFSIAEGQTGTAWSGIGNANASGYKDYVSAIEKVVVSEGITRVGSGAFAYSVPNLKEVTLPSTLTEVGNYAFVQCTKLETVNVDPNSRFSIGDGAFSSCGALLKNGTLLIPEGVTSIGTKAFNGLQSLKTLIIPNTVTKIGELAFRNAVNLESAVIPANVTEIDDKAFLKADETNKLDKMIVSCVKDSAADIYAKKMGYPVKYVDGCGVAGTIGWTLLDNVLTVSGTGDIPAYNDGVAPWATLRDKIRTVVIGEGVTSIGADAFGGATNVKTVQLPSTLTSIGAGAFGESAKLMAVEIPDGVTTIGETAFAEGTELCVSTNSNFKDTAGYAVEVKDGSYSGDGLAAGGATIEYGIYKNGDEYILVIRGSGQMAGTVMPSAAPWYNNYGSMITKVVIDFGVTRVAGNLFKKVDAATGTAANMTALKAVSIADSVTTIQPNAFYQVGTLKEISMPNKLTTVSDYALSQIGVSSIEIPATLETFGVAAINNLESLTEIKFEQGFKKIPDATVKESGIFANSTKLTSVELPAGFEYLGNYAFRNCQALEKIVIPASCTTISDNALAECSTDKLTIYCEEGSAAETFAKTKNFKYVSYIGSGTAGNLEWNVYNGVLSFEGTGTIPDYTPSSPAPWNAYAEKVTDVSLPDSVTGIGSYAFAGLTKLAKVNIPATVTGIGESAFDGCTNLVILADVDSAAAKYAAANNINLIIGGKISDTVEWEIEDGVLTVTGTGEITNAPWADKDIYVNHVHTVIVGEGITKISGRAFERGVAVETLLLPSTVQTIDFSIMNETPSIEFAEIPAGATSFDSVFGSQGIRRLAILANKDVDVNSLLKGYARDDLKVIVADGNTAIKNNTKNTGINFETVEANGSTDDGMIRWIVTKEGSLDIYGIGDLATISTAPWASYASSIKNVYIHEGITGVGAGLFADVTGAYIELADSITSLSVNALSGSGNRVRVPVYVKIIEASAFGNNTTIMGYKNSCAKEYAQANSITFDERSSLRLLAIGNSYTEDMCEWIYKMADEAGIEDVVVANLMYPGRNLRRICEHIEQQDTDYIYYKHTYSVSRSVADSNVNILQGIKAEDWDVIALQAWYPEAAYGLDGIGQDETKWLTTVTNYIKQNATNKNVELAFNMVWAQERELSDDVTEPIGYTPGHNRNNYGNTVSEYQRIVEQTKKSFGEGSELGYKYVLPIGTGIENARTSYLAGIRGTTKTTWGNGGDLQGGLQRDTCHLNYLGKYVADLIWMEMLTDVTIDEITYTPEVTYADGTVIFDADVVATAKEAAKAAVENPYEITASTSPFRIMSYVDGNATIAVSNVVRTTDQDTATQAKTLPAKVIFAEYSGEGLVSCAVADAGLMYDEDLSTIEQSPAMSSGYTKNIISDIDFAPTKGNTVKVMLWDSLDDIKPLARVIEMTAE